MLDEVTKPKILLLMAFSNTLLRNGSSETGLSLETRFLAPFLKIGTVIAVLNIEGKTPVEKHLFIMSQTVGKNIAWNSIKIFTGIQFWSCLVIKLS